MKRSVLVTGLLASLIFILACGTSVPTATPAPTEPVTVTATETPVTYTLAAGLALNQLENQKTYLVFNTHDHFALGTFDANTQIFTMIDDTTVNFKDVSGVYRTISTNEVKKGDNILLLPTELNPIWIGGVLTDGGFFEATFNGFSDNSDGNLIKVILDHDGAEVTMPWSSYIYLDPRIPDSN